MLHPKPVQNRSALVVDRVRIFRVSSLITMQNLLLFLIQCVFADVGDPPPWDGDMAEADPTNVLYHAKFGSSRSNRTSVFMKKNFMRKLVN